MSIKEHNSQEDSCGEGSSSDICSPDHCYNCLQKKGKSPLSYGLDTSGITFLVLYPAWVCNLLCKCLEFWEFAEYSRE